MSELSYLEKLLDGENIKWKPLWQVTVWDKKFNAVDRLKQLKIINYQYLLAAELFELEQESGDVFLLSTGERTGWTNESLAGSYLREGEVVTIPWGKSRPVKDIIKYYKGRFVTADNRIATSKNTDELLNKYLYYWMMSQSQIIDSYYRGSGIQHPCMANILDMLIPLPSVEIQAEIVRILDTFTALTAELTAELTARKKQYNYYRDQLLNFDDGEVEWKTLGEVAKKIYSGGTPDTKNPEYWDDGVIPWMSSGEVNLKIITETEKYISNAGFNNSSAKIVPKNSIVMALAGQGKTRGKVARTRIELTTNQSLAAITFDEKKINSDYIFHFLDTQYENLRQISSGNSGRGGLNLQMISTYKVPIPCPGNPVNSFAIQSAIVSILDKFDTLTNSITEGLPREIELRQKQYEYYRDLLFSFPKPESVNN
ncbi:TPA: restriction endonuclease subunit S [Morganella morganii]